MNREQTLQEALKCVTKDRQNTYGTPESNFACIANLWSAYLGVPVTANQVAVMMILLKISRTKTSPSYEDNYVDIAGYAACAAELTSPVNTDVLFRLSQDLRVNVAEGDVSKGAKVEC